MIHHGDCLDVMAGMEPESVSAVVTDPPYDLTDIGRTLQMAGSWRQSKGFMGKSWDGTGIAFDPATWAAAYRVAKPSAYLLAFGGTRTVHRMTCAIEDAGWIIRDMLVWAYASGFPKSKVSLKPAWEPIVMARKPGPLAMLNIDGCRIAATGRPFISADGRGDSPNGIYGDGLNGSKNLGTTDLGRWPANVILTDPIFDGGWEGVVGGGETTSNVRLSEDRDEPGATWSLGRSGVTPRGVDDSGTYSRFFLIPKADRGEREPKMSGLTAKRETAHRRTGAMDTPYLRGETFRLNHHPTVKPLDLMRHLVRLVTPTGGTVLDPFLGSGTTGIAAEMEGYPWIGIEREAEYVAIAHARLEGVQRGMGLVG